MNSQGSIYCLATIRDTQGISLNAYRYPSAKFRTMAEYTVHADTTEHELPSDPIARADVEHVLEHGYVILENVFSKAKAESTKAEMRRLQGDAPLVGRNPFEGLDTNRIYSLLNK